MNVIWVYLAAFASINVFYNTHDIILRYVQGDGGTVVDPDVGLPMLIGPDPIGSLKEVSQAGAGDVNLELGSGPGIAPIFGDHVELDKGGGQGIKTSFSVDLGHAGAPGGGFP